MYIPVVFKGQLVAVSEGLISGDHLSPAGANVIKTCQNNAIVELLSASYIQIVT
jgi:hypothetical protein